VVVSGWVFARFLHSILILEKRNSFDTPYRQLALNLCHDNIYVHTNLCSAKNRETLVVYLWCRLFDGRSHKNAGNRKKHREFAFFRRQYYIRQLSAARPGARATRRYTAF